MKYIKSFQESYAKKDVEDAILKCNQDCDSFLLRDYEVILGDIKYGRLLLTYPSVHFCEVF